jgi:hypothetical protein
MDDVEALIETLHVLYEKLETLRAMEGPELLLPGRTKHYQSVLEDAYMASSRIETTVDELGQELEYQHQRLDEEEKERGTA